jgi:hypothetical protein
MTSMRRILPALATLVPPAAALAFILAFAVDAPHIDDWTLLPVIANAHAGSPELTDYWALHNEHVVLFPRAVAAALSLATGWDLRMQIVASFAFFCGTLAFAGVVLRRVPGMSPWALPVASCFIFSLHTTDNWLWASQLYAAMALFGAVGAFALLGADRVGTGRVLAATALGIVASWSFLSGMIAWPIGVLVLLAREQPSGTARVRALLIWCAGAALAVGVPAVVFGPKGDWGKLGGWSWDLVDFVARYLGAGVVGPDADARVSRVVGGAAHAAIVALLLRAPFRDRERPARLALAAIGALGLAAGYMIALGRLKIGGLDAAMANRYATFSCLCWIHLLAALLVDAPASRSVLRVAGRVAAAVAIGVLIVTQAGSLEEGRASRERRQAIAAAMTSGEGMSWHVLEEAFAIPYRDLPDLAGRLRRLRRFDLSFFHGAVPEPASDPEAGARLTATVSSAPFEGRTRGAVDVAGGVPGNLGILMIAGGAADTPAALLTFDASGKALVPFELPALPEDLAFYVMSLDREGNVIRSATWRVGE